MSERPLVLVFGDGLLGTPAADLVERRYRLAREGDAPVGVIGVSDGAAVALAAAAALAEPPKAIVLVSPPDKVEGVAAAPVCVILGTEAAGEGAVAAWRKRFRGCNVVLVYGAGGDVAAERPEALASAAGDFLHRQGRFSFAAESVAVFER